MMDIRDLRIAVRWLLRHLPIPSPIIAIVAAATTLPARRAMKVNLIELPRHV
jgi:hypothetical protein